MEFSGYSEFSKRRAPCKRNQRGFTLIELLVVIAIVAILVSLIVPLIQDGINKALMAKCQSNMRQIGMYVNLWKMENNTTRPWMVADNGADWPHEFQDSIPYTLIVGLYPSGPRRSNCNQPVEVEDPSIFFCPAHKVSAPPNWMKDPDVYSSIPHHGHGGGSMDRSPVAGTYVWHWRNYSKRSRPYYYQQDRTILPDERAEQVLATDAPPNWGAGYESFAAFVGDEGPYYRVRHMTTLYIDGHVEQSLDDPTPMANF